MDIKSMSLNEVQREFELLNEPKYHAEQVYKWLHRGIISFNDMTNISKALREKLSQKYFITTASIEKKLESGYDETRKYLISFNDGELIEAVTMKYRHGYSLCISTQVGCKMGCSFCATGKGGFRRNLKPSEMVSQVQVIEKDLGARISNIVLMGMGEPLDNFYNVVKFIYLVTSSQGINLGVRHISLSTCGVVDKIYELASKKLGITLSISLHAPNDKIRSKLMKINNRFNLDDLMKACDFYSKATNRRISYEYALINNVNDMDQCAWELSRLLKNRLCHVNLIPVNNVDLTDFKKSEKDRVDKFKSILEKCKINVTVRRTLGSDINGSCGQLRGRHDKGGNQV